MPLFFSPPASSAIEGAVNRPASRQDNSGAIFSVFLIPGSFLFLKQQTLVGFGYLVNSPGSRRTVESSRAAIQGKRLVAEQRLDDDGAGRPGVKCMPRD